MKGLPRWLWFLVGVVVFVVVLALAAPYFLDVDRYRTTIASAIEKETGRKVSIGKIRARFLPSVGFVVEGVGIGNPSGFAEGNLLAAESLRGSLAWGPLFRREFQLSAIEIVHPTLALLEDDRGNVNYDLEAPKKPAAKKSAEESGFRLADIDSIELKDVELVVARVTGSRRRVVPQLRAMNLNVSLRDIALDAKKLKQWQADADLSGVELQLSGLKAPIEFRSGDLKLRNGGLESEFELALANVTKAKGKLSVGDVEHARAKFDLSTSLLDLDQLTATMADAEPVPPSAADRSGKSELIGQGRITAQKIRWAPYELSDVTTDLRVFTDRMELWPAKANLYGGALQATIRVDRRQAVERFSTNIQLRNLDVAAAMAASPSTKGKMTGTGELDLQVFGALDKNVMNSLTGNGKFAVREGRFPGFNLGALSTLSKVQQALSFGKGGGGGDITNFRSIDGDLQIGGGRVSSNRIHLDSPSGTVDLRGSFGFNKTLSYDGQAVLAKSASGSASPADTLLGALGGVTGRNVSNLSVPFAVRGTFDNPQIGPGRGLPGMQTAPAQQTTQQQPEEKKKSILDLFRKP